MSFVFNSHTKFNSSLLFTQGEIQLIPSSHQDTLSLPQNIKGTPAVHCPIARFISSRLAITCT